MYANKLFNKWGIGKKQEDNGVLVLIALKERIETGYDLEPILPGGLCREIIREGMAPFLRANKYGGCFAQGNPEDSGVLLFLVLPLIGGFLGNLQSGAWVRGIRRGESGGGGFGGLGGGSRGGGGAPGSW